MTTPYRPAFFAYPCSPRDLVETIETASAVANSSDQALTIEVWPQMVSFGLNIPDEVRRKIANADILVCDVTCPNSNVYYEAGFAVGAGKAIAPVVNPAFAEAVSNLTRDGLFDNIGYKE